MKSKRKLIIAVIVLWIFYILTGCGIPNVPEPMIPDMDIDKSAEKSENQSKPPVAGGELVIPIPSPDTLNPLLTQSRDMINFFGLIFEGLFKYDENMKPQPCLAESWEVEDEGKLWRFHLRKGVKYHDGQTLAGEDIVFTFIALQGKTLGSFYEKGIADNAPIERIEVDPFDPYTINVYLSQPISNMLDMMTFPVLPKQVYQSDVYMLENKENMELLPVGTGPYRIVTGDFENNQLKLIKNKDWWGKQPYIDTIIAKIYEDDAQVMQAFNNREVDLTDVTIVTANPHFRDESVKLYRYLTRDYDFLGFNMNHSILSDIRIRKAIAYALDRKDIIFKVYLNNAEAVDVPIPSDSWLYNNDYRIYDFEPEKAIELLEKAGWVDSDGDGVRDKHIDSAKVDLKFSIMTNENNNLRKDALELMAKQLKQVGMDVEIQRVPWDDLKDNLEKGHFEAVLTGYYFDLFPQLEFLFHSEQIGAGLNNFMGYRNEELDGWLYEAQIEYDQKELEGLYSRIQKHLVDQVPIVSLYFHTASLMTNSRVCGIKAPRELNIYRNIEEWYLQP
jgi:peptide/nickel transport system substrate-binding protein